MRRVVKPLVVVAALLVATSCTDDDTPESEASTPETLAADLDPVATTQPARESDGVLTIGVLLPQTGQGATLGIPGTTAANLAVSEINEAGGVNGEDVRFVREDEGDSLDAAQAAIDRLLEQDVDAIVGPASSLVALQYLDDLMAAGVLTCSPLATAMALDEFPNRELFFRTIASDSMSAEGIAVQARRTGVTTATVVYVDDAYGRPLARAVIAALGNLDVEVVAERPLNGGDTDFTDDASAIAESEPGTLIVLADSNRGWAMLGALAQVFDDPPRIVVSDPLRQPPSADQVAALPANFRSAVEGISPSGTPQGDEPVGPFATNSYDCVNLIALAAVMAGTDAPTDIARQIRTVANSGAGCNDFLRCIDTINDDRDIDYNGPRGRLSIGANGDPGLGLLMLFGFPDESGIAKDLGAFTIPD
jgi:branched-chain amino acid transport system substrate-binding protein